MGHSVKCIYHAYISHVSRYSLDQKKDSSRTLEGLVSVSSRTGLANVSVSGAQVSGGLGLCLDPEGLEPIHG